MYCAEFLVHFLREVKHSRCAEVDHLQQSTFLVAFVEEVFGFQVAEKKISFNNNKQSLPMNNLVTVAIEDSRQDLFEGLSCLLLAEGFLLEDLIEQLPTGTQFGDDVEEALLLIKFEHLDDVWVILWNYYFFDKLRNTNRKKLFLSFLLEKLKYQFLEDVDLVDQFLLFFL